MSNSIEENNMSCNDSEFLFFDKKRNHVWVGECVGDATHYIELPELNDARWIPGKPIEKDVEYLTQACFYPSQNVGISVEIELSNGPSRYPNHRSFEGCKAYMKVADAIVGAKEIANPEDGWYWISVAEKKIPAYWVSSERVWKSGELGDRYSNFKVNAAIGPRLLFADAIPKKHNELVQLLEVISQNFDDHSLVEKAISNLHSLTEEAHALNRLDIEFSEDEGFVFLGKPNYDKLQSGTYYWVHPIVDGCFLDWIPAKQNRNGLWEVWSPEAGFHNLNNENVLIGGQIAHPDTLPQNHIDIARNALVVRNIYASADTLDQAMQTLKSRPELFANLVKHEAPLESAPKSRRP